jgi:hypothetical protein
MSVEAMGVFDIVMEKPAEVSRSDGSSTDFSRFFHDYIKHTHRFDGHQQIFSGLYQTHPSPRLTSASEKPAEVSRSGECV